MNIVNNFVVYAYESEEDGLFYYIGKGRPDRPYKKIGRTVQVPACRSRIHILQRNLDEETAYGYEKKFIQLYGRKDIETGWCRLENRTNGGSGFSGIRHSGEWRKRISEQMSGESHYMYTPLNWFHSLCGEVYGKSVAELSRLYPEQNLVVDHLRRVSKGEKSFYKGWRLLDKEIFPVNYDQPRYNWFHPDHGIFMYLRVQELRELFSETLEVNKNAKRLLVKVSKGKKLSYKGWMLYNGVESPEEDD
jgi:hypothetical protein